MVDLSNNSLSNAIKIIEDWQPQDVKQAARTFPQEMYTSSAIYRWEQERIFGKAWYYVGHLSQLNGAGSFFTVNIAEQPLIILLNKVGELRAFFNICPHRAAPVALGSGECHKLTCIYHAWTFDLDGNLKGAPEMEDVPGFNFDEHRLISVKVSRWGQFIFVNLDPNCQPLEVQLGELPALFKNYRLEDWVLVHSQDYWTPSNWKFFVENNAESYHEPIVHPIIAKYYQHIQVEARHHYYLQYTPYLNDEENLLNLKISTYLEGLNPREIDGCSIMSFFPNFAWVLGPSYAVIYLIDPQGKSQTRIQVAWLVPNIESLKSPANVQHLITIFENILQEDFHILSYLQKNVESLGYHQGRLTPYREMGTHLFQQLIMQYLRHENSGVADLMYKNNF